MLLRTFNSSRPYTKLASSLLLAGLIAGCTSGCSKGSDSTTSSEHNHDHEDTEIESSGVLALFNSDTNSIDMLNIDDQQVLNSFALSGSAPRLYTSPEGRYAVSIQRSDNLVSFFDSGLYSEDHGDHLHDYQDTPSDTGITLNGIAPTHYSVFDEQGVIFNDGADGTVSSFALISDEVLTGNDTIASLELDNRMHGVAKLINDKLFVTYRDLSVTETTLPEQVERYSFDGTNFTLDTRYSEGCPGLHGAGANENYLVFGCSDGVLSINIGDASYTATHSANPASFAEGARIGSVYGHHEVDELIGTVGAHGSSTRNLFRLAPGTVEVISEFALPENDTAITQGFTHSGEIFYALSQDGELHFYHSADWLLSHTLPLISNDQLSLERGESPLVVASKADEALYVLNPNTNQVHIVNATSGSLVTTIELAFNATSIAWLGLTSAHEHEH
ncbi:hypothetical protein [Litoribacillus peritrichatus]|uniref:hypothetical protein n=1 Tax=Litoribacillus peritrichatus TaxID=718191 RepID=UPI0031D74AA2